MVFGIAQILIGSAIIAFLLLLFLQALKLLVNANKLIEVLLSHLSSKKNYKIFCFPPFPWFRIFGKIIAVSPAWSL